MPHQVLVMQHLFKLPNFSMSTSSSVSGILMSALQDCHSPIHSLNQYLLYTYYGPEVFLGAGKRVVNKTRQVPAHGGGFALEREANKKSLCKERGAKKKLKLGDRMEGDWGRWVGRRVTFRQGGHGTKGS